MSLKYQVIRTKWHLYYYRHGEYHRILKPALISHQSGGSYYWMEYNLLHRFNGPADVSIGDGKLWYFIRGKNYTKEEYESKIPNKKM